MNRRKVLLAGAVAAAAAGWRLTAGRGATASPAAVPTGRPLPPDANPALGVNLTLLNERSPTAFIDRLKSSPPWETYGRPAPMDARGYPTGLGGETVIFTYVPCEEGTYVLLHDGDMDVRLLGATLVSSGRGRIVFRNPDIPAPGRQLKIVAIRKPPTFMHFINQKDEAAFAAGEIFAPELLAQLRGFDTLRFMDWMRTNGSPVTDSFPAVDACSYAAGVPIEVMTALARKVGAHAWLCVPHLATDACVTRLIATLKAATNGGPAPYLEYSNEVWNTQFEQTRYAAQQAAERWGANTPAGVYYGFRAGQIAQLARGSGVRMVLGNQTVLPFRADPVWDGVRRSGATDRDFHGWIIATYVSGTLVNSDGPTLALAANDDVAGAVDNLLHDPSPRATSVARMAPIYADHGRIAAAHGLKLLAYEGNMHLNAFPGFAGQTQQVVPFFDKLTKSPAAAAVFEANLAAFGAAGGSLACLYNLAGRSGQFGIFGVVGSGAWSAIQARLARRR